MRTGTVSYKLEDLKKGVIIPIGFVGENDFTRVIFDAEEIYKKYPSASVSMKVQPPKGVIYPATVTRDGNAVIWQVKEADVANRGGGELQLTFTDGETKIKTYIARTDVKRSLAGNGPAPDPVQDWVDNAEEVLDDLAAMDNIAKTALEGDIGKALSPKTVENGVVTEWQFVEPGAGTDDYADLDNKPSIAGVTLSGNKTLEDLGIASDDDLDNLADEVSDVKNAIQGLDDDKYEKPSGGIPATDLTQAVQNSLSAADSAYQKPSGGIPASDIADGVIPVVDSALSDSSENAVQNKVVKGALDGKAPVIINTATGNPAVFSDGADGLPIQSLKVHLLAQQEGTGDPSPQNIRSILPWNGLTVCHGVNLLPENSVSRTSNGIAIVRTNGHVKISGTVVNTGEYNAAVTGSFEADGSYCVVYGVPKAQDGATWYVYDGGNRITGQDINGIPFQTREGRNTMIGLSIGLGISINVEFDPVMFKTSETTETDISFPSPVYGGIHEAVSGKLIDGWKTETFDGSSDELWNFTQVGTSAFYRAYIRISDIAQDNDVAILSDKYKAVSFDNMSFSQKVCMATNKNESPQYVSFITDETTIEAFKAWLAENPVTIAYMTATPQEIQLTPTQITALIGNNTIWSDADGSMTIEYPADTKTYINNLIATAIASL